MQETMRAIRIHAVGDSGAMVEDRIAIPTPNAGEVLVKVAYAGVNFIDVYKRRGLYKVPLPSTLGEEGAGVVESVGADVTELKSGDHVAWAGVLGAYAEYAIVPAARLVPVPANVDLKLAAAVMLQGMTAHYLSMSSFVLKPGDRALVHAAAGGVGLLLVQIAKMRGAEVIATAGSAEKLQLAAAAGADAVINYSTHDFAAEVLRLTDGKKVHVIYDSVGASTFLPGLDLLVPRGMMVLFGQSSGVVAPFDPLLLSQKGSLFLTRPTMNHYVAERQELLARAGDLFSWIGEGKLSVRVGAEFTLAEAGAAHDALEGRRTTGKVLLRV